jgi:hypothetical protein
LGLLFSLEGVPDFGIFVGVFIFEADSPVSILDSTLGVFNPVFFFFIPESVINEPLSEEKVFSIFASPDLPDAAAYIRLKLSLVELTSNFLLVVFFLLACILIMN